MGLKHIFAVIDKNCEESIIESDWKQVTISDEIIKYISDSINWINTADCNRKYIAGLSYHGFNIIEGENIKKLKQIIQRWVDLFEIGDDELILTGDYLIDECKYEKNHLKKNTIVPELRELMKLCDVAINEGKNLLYNGV